MRSIAPPFIIIVLLAPTGMAQEKQPTCDVPLVVTRFDSSSRTVQTVTNLGVTDLALQVGPVPVSAESVRVDDGPKRPVLVLDASPRIPKDEWELETDMAASLIARARPQDRFALLLVAGEGGSTTFSAVEEIRDRLHQLRPSRPIAKEPGEPTVQVLIAAARLLNPPQFGDTIFLFGHDEDAGSPGDLDQFREMILREGVRFYGVSFTNPLEGRVPPGFNPNKPLLAGVGPSNLAKVCMATGYSFSFFSVKALSYPGQIQMLKGHLADLYAGIAAPYRVAIPAASVETPIGLKVTVAKAQELQIIARDVHSPSFVYPCTPNQVHNVAQ